MSGEESIRRHLKMAIKAHWLQLNVCVHLSWKNAKVNFPKVQKGFLLSCLNALPSAVKLRRFRGIPILNRLCNCGNNKIASVDICFDCPKFSELRTELISLLLNNNFLQMQNHLGYSEIITNKLLWVWWNFWQLSLNYITINFRFLCGMRVQCTRILTRVFAASYTIFCLVPH